MLGGAFGVIGHHLLSGVVGSHTSGYAISGLAAVFAGTAQAPITSIMILFELTTDYTIILPLMLTVVTATVVGRALSQQTIYTLKLFRRGVDLTSGRDANIMRQVRVEDAMEHEPETVAPEMSIDALVEHMNSAHRLSFPVVDCRGDFLGMVRAEDIEESLLVDEDTPQYTVAEIVERSPTVAAWRDRHPAQGEDG